MAKKAKVEKNKARMEMVERYRERRSVLKKRIGDSSLSDGERQAARLRLQSLPRDSSPIRVRNRCGSTGRTRGYLKKFDLSRIAFRELALKGDLPGVKKASW